MLADAASQVGNPAPGFVPGFIGFGSAAVGACAVSRVGAEEADVCLLRLNVLQAVGDAFISDMALELDQEAVVAKLTLCRSRLEVG